METIDFIQLDKTSGTGNDTVQLSTDKNSSFSSKNRNITVKTNSNLQKIINVKQKVFPSQGMNCYWYSVNGQSYCRIDESDFRLPYKEFTISGTQQNNPFSFQVKTNEWVNYTSDRFRVTKQFEFPLEATFGLPTLNKFAIEEVTFSPNSLQSPVYMKFSNINYNVLTGWSGKIELELRFVDAVQPVTLGSENDLAILKGAVKFGDKTYTGTFGINGLGNNFVYNFDFVTDTNPNENLSGGIVDIYEYVSDSIYEFTPLNE